MRKILVATVAVSFVTVVGSSCATQEGARTETDTTATATGTTTGTAEAQGATAPTGQTGFTRYEADGFAISLPSEPHVERREVPVQGHTVKTGSWSVNHRGALFSAAIADYPAAMLAGRPPQATLNDAKQGLVQQLQGQLVDEQPASVDQYPGEQFTIRSEQREVKARAVLAGNRLFTLLVAYQPGQSVPQADEFLSSLDITSPPPMPASSGMDGGTMDHSGHMSGQDGGMMQGGMMQGGMDGGTDGGSR